ncbi:MAG: hypothetical protein Q9225_004906 [Loekoesia sp. 1 TL-2023]
MSRRKRQRERDADAQGSPFKKRATSPAFKNSPNLSKTFGLTESESSKSTSGIHKRDTIGGDYKNKKTCHLNDEGIKPKSGYESLDLLEEALMNPSKVYVPSSLPPGQPNQQTGNESNLSQDQDDLPELPKIQDPHFAEAPFTHQGTLGDAAYAHRDKLSLNYERLEFLGDAYLELIASRVVLPRFPSFDPGKLSQTRQLLVCNETLANFSERYGFDTRARLPAEIGRKKGSQEKAWIKVMGDIFEAYVAALIISDPENGHSIAEKWLAELWEPLLLRQVNPKVADPKAKQVLATKIMTKGTKINYRDAGHPEHSKGHSTFFIKVFYTGLGYTDFCLGSGKGPSKPEAGYDAATNALSHPRLAEIMAKKKQFDLKSKVERNHQNANEKTNDG